VAEVTAEEIQGLWKADHYTLLAGCAPCQPFSTHRRGADPSADSRWSLLDNFARLVRETKPDFVTMENVPGLARTEIFRNFVDSLSSDGYHVAHRIIYCPDYGLAQNRRRLVLLASRLGRIELPERTHLPRDYKSVRDVIGTMEPLESGGQHPTDPLHKCRDLSDINLERIRASTPGGTWKDWPEHLVANCHKRSTGASFRSVYARMEWDKPAPTITTQAHNFGTGRFGHPDQDRPISLREAAMLQGFPESYKFVPHGSDVYFTIIGRLIGNAVPPIVGRIVGATIRAQVKKSMGEKRVDESKNVQATAEHVGTRRSGNQPL
jgi:DNA (cytosine-5)-methyltransferase 1